MDVGEHEMMKKLITLATILTITIACLIGCGETTNFLGGTTEEKKETIRSEDVYIPIEKIRTLNPVVTKDEDAYYVGKLIYEGLFGFDKNLAVTNVLADHYSYDSEEGAITISLKRNIYWQDGEELTAEDVKFTMDVITSASYSGNTLYQNCISNIKYTKLNKQDPYQITISYNNPLNISLSNLTFPIIPQHRFKNIDGAKKADQDFIPIGTGPYQVEEYNALSHITLKASEKYHGSIKPVNTLHFQIIPEKRDAANLMNINNFSVAFSKELDRDTIYTNEDVNIASFPSNEVEFIGYNFNNPVLKYVKVRKAIASAINTEQIIESAYYKNGVQNDNIYFPSFLGINSNKSNNLFDIAKSKNLLQEAGFYDRNGDGYLESASGETLRVNILVNSDNPSRVAAAQIIKEGLDMLPIPATIISKEWNEYNTDLAGGNFDIFVGGYQFRENYDLRFLLHSGYGNPAGYSNPALDVWLDKMESGVSQQERQSSYEQVSKILIDELPYFCLLYKTYGAITSPSLEGGINPNFLNLYQGAENWYSMIEVPSGPTEEESVDELEIY